MSFEDIGKSKIELIYIHNLYKNHIMRENTQYKGLSNM
jgi:hypothetical protein